MPLLNGRAADSLVWGRGHTGRFLGDRGRGHCPDRAGRLGVRAVVMPGAAACCGPRDIYWAAVLDPRTERVIALIGELYAGTTW
ncbi:hypothetical protein NCAST_36_00210 [Nocardia asteroides NBRC 15531]|uniref:Uncharacterized protein n=1 Tax=Nocardia asteroides NBRC 15531 TaxID=1110697 RepID=U5ERB6_NOCAS|nr:hypothetical protein NCAST_36_00210 [Nocardia asteroides NBRC 15531]